VRRAEWATHGWAHIHPVQDPQGKKVEVDAGFRSRSSVIGERGDDPDEVDAERAADREREEQLGLHMVPAGPGEPTNPASLPDEDSEDDQADESRPQGKSAFNARKSRDNSHVLSDVDMGRNQA